jgi:para-aminobenzoate synthetase component 1
MNYMFQRTAAKWAHAQQADEAVLLGADGSVSETNTANILCRIDGKLLRPLSEHLLPGTMEQAVCELLANWGVPIEQRRITVDDLKRAEHIIGTNAPMGAVPVVSIDGQAVAVDAGLCRRINDVMFGGIDDDPRSPAPATLG